jgi:hypothetical protein
MVILLHAQTVYYRTPTELFWNKRLRNTTCLVLLMLYTRGCPPTNVSGSPTNGGFVLFYTLLGNIFNAGEPLTLLVSVPDVARQRITNTM